ncbi:unnamed protein product [Ectocarpus sp. 12 AP-2014]
MPTSAIISSSHTHTHEAPHARAQRGSVSHPTLPSKHRISLKALHRVSNRPFHVKCPPSTRATDTQYVATAIFLFTEEGRLERQARRHAGLHPPLPQPLPPLLRPAAAAAADVVLRPAAAAAAVVLRPAAVLPPPAAALLPPAAAASVAVRPWFAADVPHRRAAALPRPAAVAAAASVAVRQWPAGAVPH